MLNQQQKQAIRNIMTQPGWEVMMLVVDKFLKNWEDEPVKMENEFETLWHVAQREAKGRALKEFFKELEENVD